MPPFQLPPNVPLGLWWYVLWISIHGVFLYLLRQLGDLHGDVKEKADKEANHKLPSLSEYLWRLVEESSGNPYDAIISSPEDLMSLYNRVRRASRSMVRYNRLRRHAGLGRIASSIAIAVALILGGIYYTRQPVAETVIMASIIAFVAVTAWASYHFGNVVINNLLIVRVSDED